MPRLADHRDTENGPSDEEGEKEAKRQRSEPTTPTSTSSTLPYEYDAVMGITQVDPRDTEGFEEGLDLEYHDATEDPRVLEPAETMREPVLSHGGCGSSSLRDCIELLNNIERNAPAALRSGVKMDNNSDPRQNTLTQEPHCMARLKSQRGHLPETLYIQENRLGKKQVDGDSLVADHCDPSQSDTFFHEPSSPADDCHLEELLQ